MDREEEIAELKRRLAALEGEKPTETAGGLPPPTLDDGTPIPAKFAEQAKVARKAPPPIFMGISVVVLIASLASPKFLVSLPLALAAAAAVVSIIRREAAWGISVLALIGAGMLFLWAADGLPSASSSGEAASASAASANLKVTLGRGSRKYGTTTYPVVVENDTGGALSYLEARCTFYDAAGQLVETQFTNWTNVAPGERASGSIRVDAADVDKYECVGKAN
jgi:hypothetical protein